MTSGGLGSPQGHPPIPGRLWTQLWAEILNPEALPIGASLGPCPHQLLLLRGNYAPGLGVALLGPPGRSLLLRELLAHASVRVPFIQRTLHVCTATSPGTRCLPSRRGGRSMSQHPVHTQRPGEARQVNEGGHSRPAFTWGETCSRCFGRKVSLKACAVPALLPTSPAQRAARPQNRGSLV